MPPPPENDVSSAATEKMATPPTGYGKTATGVNGSDSAPEMHGRRPRRVAKWDIDDTAHFYIQNKDTVGPLTQHEELGLVRKNFWCLLSQTWWVAFLIHLDKSTLAQASIMGIFEDVAMTKNEFNHLYVAFYAGYLIALWPGAALSQRVGHKHFITGSLLLWSLLLGMHCVVRTGRQMLALRFVLGMVSHLLPNSNRRHVNARNDRPSHKSCPRRRFCTRPSSRLRRAPGSSSSGGPPEAWRTSS